VESDLIVRPSNKKLCHFFPQKRLIPYIGNSARAEQTIRRNEMNWSCDWSRVALATVIALVFLSAPYVWAQTLGTSPQFNVAVQGQTGAQPEGAFFNFINWIGNVIAPVGAGGAVFGAVVAFISGRAVGRWLLTSAALLGVSGLTRLLEFWVLQGVGGVS